jgi:hypothetical protein
MIEIDQYARGELTLISVSMSGRLTERELRVFLPHFESEIRHHKKLRLLMQLGLDLSWEPRSNWRSLSFNSRHSTSVSRLAVVGAERRWRQWLVKACASLSVTTTLHFHPRRIVAARQWLFGRDAVSSVDLGTQAE